MSNKKKINKEIRRKHKLKLEIEQNPDWCFCYEILGLMADVDYERDLVIDMTDPIDGFPFPESKDYSIPIYKCKRCGKKHTLPVAY